MPTRRTFLGTLATTAATGRSDLRTPLHAQAQRSPARPHLKAGAVTYNIAKDWDLGRPSWATRRGGNRGRGAAHDARARRRDLAAAGGATRRPRPVRRRTRPSRQPRDDVPVPRCGPWRAARRRSTRPSVDPARGGRRRGQREGAAERAACRRPRRSVARADRARARRVQPRGRGRGIRIQLEVHGPQTSHVPAIHRILQHAGEPPAPLWVCWNSNQTDLEDGGLEANFRLVQHRIGQVHMRDLYIDEYPWRQLVHLLQGMNFDGYCYAELGEPSCDGVRVLKYFKGMLRALEG